jgi:hypothetical protein
MRRLKKNSREVFRAYIIRESGTLPTEYTKYREIFKEEIGREALPEYQL